MKHESAMQCALGYAWGAEDHGAVTSPPAGKTAAECTPSYEFAEAFAAGYDALNSGGAYFMTSVQGAYRCWNESGGKSIFRDEEKAS